MEDALRATSIMVGDDKIEIFVQKFFGEKINHTNSPQFSSLIRKEIGKLWKDMKPHERNKKIILNFKEVDHFGVSTISAIVAINKFLLDSKKEPIKLTHLNIKNRQLLGILNHHMVFEIE